MRTVDVEQFCSWSACRMSSWSSAGDDLRVGLVLLVRDRERHAQEVLDVPARVVRVEQGLALGGAVHVRGDRPGLGQDEHGGELDRLRVERVQRLGVERGQGVDGRRHDGHRVPAAREGAHEGAEVLMDQRVPVDTLLERGQLVGARQLAVDEQVGDLEERGLAGQLLDRVAAVAQDALVAVDVRDLGLARGGVHEAGVHGDQAGVAQQGRDDDAVVAVGGRHDGQVSRGSVDDQLDRRADCRIGSGHELPPR